jgi:hypothetical protein
LEEKKMLIGEKLCMFLALGSMASVYGENSSKISKDNYTNIYENITKNTGKASSNESYKLLEKILNIRNKELKDLYMQNDYVVKPEYLEWQIFFSGFYNNSHRGGSKDKAVSFVSGETKKIKQGKAIPIMGITKERPDLNIIPPREPAVRININPAAVPPQIAVPNPVYVETPVPSAPAVGFTDYKSQINYVPESPGSNSALVVYNTSGNKMFENLNAESTGGTSLELNGRTNNITVTGAMSYENGTYTGTSASSYTHTGYSDSFAVHNISNNGNYEIKGSWDMKLIDRVSYENWGFLSYRPYYANTDSKVVFSGNLNMSADEVTTGIYNSNASSLIGMYLNLTSTAANPATTATLENSGTITIKNGNQSGHSNIAMQLGRGTSSYTQAGELINSGNIIIESATANADGSSRGIGIFLEISPIVKPVMVKTGNILLSGDSNRAVETGRDSLMGDTYVSSNINIDGSDGKITLQGVRNAGLYVQNAVTSTGTSLLDNVKNMSILIDGQNTPAISRETQETVQKAMDLKINDTLFRSVEFGANSKQSSIINVNYGNAIIESNMINVLAQVNTGIQNAIATGAPNTMIKNYMPINIGSGAQAMAGIATKGSFENYADIKNNSSKYADIYVNPFGTVYTSYYGSAGLALTGYYNGDSWGNLASTGFNTGNIDMNGDYATAVYNVGKLLTSGNDHITSAGNNAVGIYGGASYGFVNGSYQALPSNTAVKTNRLEVSGNNGAAVYSNGGNISLGSSVQGNALEVKADGKDTFGFLFRKYISLLGKMTLTSDVNAGIKNGAIAFYYEGAGFNDPVSIPGYLTGITDTTNGSLNILMDKDSYRIAVKSAKVNLSDLTDALVPAKISFTGSERSKLFKSTLVMDVDSNIDKNNNTSNKAYYYMEIGKSGVSVNSGVTLSGTEDGQIGIGQSFNYNESVINSENNGIINLKGDNSIGIYTKRTKISNTGLIDMSGNSGTGLFSTAGNISNTGEVRIGNHGTGIYSETYVNSSDNPYNSTQAVINNYGKITADAGEKAVGIYGNNNAVSGGSSSINLGDNSHIDVSASKGGTGIYSNKASVSSVSAPGGSKITAGENGTAIYAKNTRVSLSDIELNLTGDNSTGIYLDSSHFQGTGTVNVDGTGIVIINKTGNLSYNQNFNVNSTAGSEYSLQNITNDTLFYNNTSVLGEGGKFVTGKNSAVLLGENSDIISTGQNMTGIALSGSYTGGLPVTVNGEVLDQEAVNKGKITFKDDSTGIYVINGASGKNQGIISLGRNSTGIFGEGTGSSITNTGSITTGQNSAGMYLKNGNNILNTGNIAGTGAGTAGLYLEGNSTSVVSNEGIIDMSGDRATGIYVRGTGNQTINNNGTIRVKDPGSEADPSVGIYNESSNSIINNSGNITSGKYSTGIYSKGGQINQNSGIISIGESGTGIYINSGNLNLNSGTLEFSGINAVGIYASDSTHVDNNILMNISDGSFGAVLKSGSSLINKNVARIGNHGVFVYSDGAASVINEAGSDVIMTGSKSAGFYMINGGALINKASVTADSGDSNVAVYNKGGSIDNSGDIKIGDSLITDTANPFANSYAVGIYGEDIQSMKNTGNIETGTEAVGFYIKNSKTEALNTGDITSGSSKSTGIYLDGSALKNTGNITLSGDNSVGIAAERNSSVKNEGIITMNGNNSIGIYANANSKVINENTGKIFINGNNSTGVQLSGGSVLENYGLIEVSSGTIGSLQLTEDNPAYKIPSIINAGVIKVDEKFDLNGMNIVIKPNPASFREMTAEEMRTDIYAPEDIYAGFLVTNTVSIAAPSFNFGENPVGIDPYFTQGTNARVYKFENVFDPTTPYGGPNTGEISVKSGSLTFNAVPVTNASGKTDVWMEKIDYTDFTKGTWYDGFAKNIEKKYLNATGDALKLYDKLDLITDENNLRNDLSQLSGSMYANIIQREQNINEVFSNALNILQNSENNTKENVKINIITGKGNTKENTAGIDSYEYQTVGVLALREVERTYRHKFGYSLGYTRTDFQMKDTNNEDEADTIQLGLHNKYSTDGWNIKNDLLGKMSIHNTDRTVNWSEGTKTDLNSNYNVYGVSLLNELGKEIEINKNTKITPYAGLELGYMKHPDFEEKGGAESLRVDSNDAYSIKPNIGVRLDGEKELGAASGWKVKGNIGIGYEYELGNMNNQEKAALSAIEEGYHDLAKPSEDKGKIKTSGYAGVELKGTYGIYITGEYGRGQDNQEEYKVGISLKAVF